MTSNGHSNCLFVSSLFILHINNIWTGFSFDSPLLSVSFDIRLFLSIVLCAVSVFVLAVYFELVESHSKSLFFCHNFFAWFCLLLLAYCPIQSIVRCLCSSWHAVLRLVTLFNWSGAKSLHFSAFALLFCCSIEAAAFSSFALLHHTIIAPNAWMWDMPAFRSMLAQHTALRILFCLLCDLWRSVLIVLLYFYLFIYHFVVTRS